MGNHLSNQDGWTEKEVQIIKLISKWHNQISHITLSHNSAIWIQLCVCRAGHQKNPPIILCQSIWTILQYSRGLCTEKCTCLGHIWSWECFPQTLEASCKSIDIFLQQALIQLQFPVCCHRFLSTPARSWPGTWWN